MADLKATAIEPTEPITIVKTIKAKPKRLPKGERIHVRRMKQAAHKPGAVIP
jgi:hypothetical protein